MMITLQYAAMTYLSLCRTLCCRIQTTNPASNITKLGRSYALFIQMEIYNEW